jgi:hypothetical protein
MGVLIAACSSSAHRNLDLLPDSTGTSCPAHCVPCYVPCAVPADWPPATCSSTYRRSALVSSGPGRRNARGNARRRSARSRQPGLGCRDAPRPGSRPRGSGIQRSSTTTMRSRSLLAARIRQPTQVRSGRGCPPVRPDTDQSTLRGPTTSNAFTRVWCAASRLPGDCSSNASRSPRERPPRRHQPCSPYGFARLNGLRCPDLPDLRHAGTSKAASGEPDRVGRAWRVERA